VTHIIDPADIPLPVSKTNTGYNTPVNIPAAAKQQAVDIASLHSQEGPVTQPLLSSTLLDKMQFKPNNKSNLERFCAGKKYIKC
jgi:hypothetical protein